jgi:hypothetical protein
MRSCWHFLPILAVFALPAWAGDTKDAQKKDGVSPLRRAGREFLQDVESSRKELERDSSAVGLEAREAAKRAFAAAAAEVRGATREFWDDVIREKERLREKLRRENRELRARQKQ